VAISVRTFETGNCVDDAQSSRKRESVPINVSEDAGSKSGQNERYKASGLSPSPEGLCVQKIAIRRSDKSGLTSVGALLL
jgi:hypothetical protein